MGAVTRFLKSVKLVNLLYRPEFRAEEGRLAHPTLTGLGAQVLAVQGVCTCSFYYTRRGDVKRV